MNVQNAPYKYKAFLSYSHKDEAFARWLQKGIENYKIPKALREKYPNLPLDLKRSVFRDEEELSSASALSVALKEALLQSEKLIVLASLSSSKSFWVKEEINYFLELNGEKNIIVVALDSRVEELIPKVLETKSETLVIHSQTKKQSKRSLLKVIAAILEVDFSDLWRREKRERQKRFILQGVFISLFVLLGLYAYFQSLAISSNQELTHIHREILKIEEALKKPKSEAVAYELNERLNILEEQKILKEETLSWFGLLNSSVTKKAKELYDKEGIDAALNILESVESLHEDEEYAKKNILRAKLYIEKGAFEKANTFYEKAIQVDDAYVNVYDYALFLSKQKHLKKAKKLYEQLQTYVLTKEKRANVLNKLGILYRKLGQSQRAEKVYLEALSLRQILVQKHPQKYQEDLAWTYNNMGVLYKELNRTTESESSHFKALELRQGLLSKEKSEPFHVACSLHNLGELYAGMKKQKDAEAFYLNALKIRRALVVKNPKKYNHALAWTLYDLGRLYVETKRYAKAEQFFKDSLALRKKLLKVNFEAYAKVYAETLNELGKLYLLLGENKKAKLKFEELLEHYAPLGEMYKEEQEGVHKLLGNINRLLA